MIDPGIPASTPRSPYDDGTFRVGDIVVAGVLNPLENRKSKGKNRPFVLVRRVSGHWRGMGLTTSSHYANGAPRQPIPDPTAAGLHRPGFLWGDRLTNVCVLDIHGSIGRVTPLLAERMISLARLGVDDAVALRLAARSQSAA